MTTTTADTATISTAAQGPRYPFRPGSGCSPEQVNAAIGQAVQDVDNMIYLAVRRRLHGRDADVQDLVQQCRVHLWAKSLPRYDAHRQPPVKVSTFLYRCIGRFATQEIRSQHLHSKSRGEVHLQPDGDARATSTAAPDESRDVAIEAFAAKVMANPEAYFTKAQAHALRQYLAARPGMPLREMCKVSGHASASILHALLKRLRMAIIKLAEKEGVIS